MERDRVEYSRRDVPLERLDRELASSRPFTDRVLPPPTRTPSMMYPNSSYAGDQSDSVMSHPAQRQDLKRTMADRATPDVAAVRPLEPAAQGILQAFFVRNMNPQLSEMRALQTLTGLTLDEIGYWFDSEAKSRAAWVSSQQSPARDYSPQDRDPGAPRVPTLLPAPSHAQLSVHTVVPTTSAPSSNSSRDLARSPRLTMRSDDRPARSFDDIHHVVKPALVSSRIVLSDGHENSRIITSPEPTRLFDNTNITDYVRMHVSDSHRTSDTPRDAAATLMSLGAPQVTPSPRVAPNPPLGDASKPLEGTRTVRVSQSLGSPQSNASAILDTGTTDNFVSKEFLQKHAIVPSSIPPTSQRTFTTPMGEITPRDCISLLVLDPTAQEGKPHQLTLYVVEGTPKQADVVLGSRWIKEQQTNVFSIATGKEVGEPKAKRTKFSEEQRQEVALTRKIGACEDCRRSKRKCTHVGPRAATSGNVAIESKKSLKDTLSKSVDGVKDSRTSTQAVDENSQVSITRSLATRHDPALPCLECEKAFPQARWREHQIRKHFPQTVWFCPQSDCGFKSAIRRDNFSTHLRGEHSFDQDAILETIKAHGYETRHLFHEVCGFCQESLPDLQSSLTHILSHLTAGQNSSTWKHQCATNHEIPVSLDHPNLARNMYANKIVNGESGDAMEVDRSPLVVSKEEDHILAVKPVMKVLRTPLPAAPVALPPPQPGPSNPKARNLWIEAIRKVQVRNRIRRALERWRITSRTYKCKRVISRIVALDRVYRVITRWLSKARVRQGLKTEIAKVVGARRKLNQIINVEALIFVRNSSTEKRHSAFQDSKPGLDDVVEELVIDRFFWEVFNPQEDEGISV